MTRESACRKEGLGACHLSDSSTTASVRDAGSGRSIAPKSSGAHRPLPRMDLPSSGGPMRARVATIRWTAAFSCNAREAFGHLFATGGSCGRSRCLRTVDFCMGRPYESGRTSSLTRTPGTSVCASGDGAADECGACDRSSYPHHLPRRMSSAAEAPILGQGVATRRTSTQSIGRVQLARSREARRLIPSIGSWS